MVLTLGSLCPVDLDVRWQTRHLLSHKRDCKDWLTRGFSRKVLGKGESVCWSLTESSSVRMCRDCSEPMTVGTRIVVARHRQKLGKRLVLGLSIRL